MRYRRLTREDRYQIAVLLKSELGIREIAALLERSPSTVSREIQRNSSGQLYLAEPAHANAVARRLCVHPPIRVRGSLAKEITTLLKKQWSPEQISGHLRIKKKTKVSHEAIYSFVYRDFKSGGQIHLNLRRRRKRRRSRAAGRGYKRCGRRLSYPPIINRPSIVEKRKRLGDYERDSVLGKFNGPVLLSVVDRATRLTKLGKIEKIDADLTHKKTTELLKGMPIHTITNDNGPEFADYKKTAKSLRAEIYFNDPYSSWQRGTNENTNGLIRQYFPKGTDFTMVTDKEIKAVERLLNNRPRKCLGYKTPFEVQKLKRQVLH